MSKREDIERKTEELLLPIITEHKFELVDVEYVKEAANYYLRAYIDKPGGITIDDCEVVSRSLSEIMDTKDFISEAYILEVSSPGLGRPLKKEKDFLRSMGEEVEVKTYAMKEVEGQKRKQKEFTGILTNYENERVTIETEEQVVITFEKSEISLIRLAFDF